MESDERPGRPLANRNSVMIDKVRALLKSDRRLTIRELAEEAEISVGSCRAIVTQELGMRRIAAKYVPEC